MAASLSEWVGYEYNFLHEVNIVLILDCDVFLVGTVSNI